MKPTPICKRILLIGIAIAALVTVTACVNIRNNESKYSKGTYGYDVAFFATNNIKTIELKDEDSKACVLLVPGYQGRVMTSTTNGEDGLSFGWINHDYIESGEISDHFNPFGGEERLWFGPEGGPFSIYFEEGKDQVFSNWVVPPVIDTEPFEVVRADRGSALFRKNAILRNASGTEFNLGIERTVSLLSRNAVSEFLGIEIPASLEAVAYQTDNLITNNGEEAWTRDNGLLSIWLLSMLNPSPSTTVFIPYEKEGAGVVVNDEYFGKVPSDRLVVKDGMIFFKIDGKLRSKIGLPFGRARSLSGSYDSEKIILTLLWCTIPSVPMPYVNSNWGEQEDPYNGDVINSYNDGPVDDGSVLGPFYELESSSPAAELQPSESINHVQKIMHFHGDESELGEIVKELFGLNIKELATTFN